MSVKPFWFALSSLQPSQLYINEDKLQTIRTKYGTCTADQLGALPILRLGEFTILTDGHTRAFHAFQLGFTQVLAYWDEDPLDLPLYEHCVHLCRRKNITAIADLAKHIISNTLYQELWIQRIAETETLMKKGISNSSRRIIKME